MDTSTKALTLQYWQDCEELLARFPEGVAEQDLDEFFLPWLASQGRRPLDDARPWITFAAARRIERHLRPSSRVFEFGAGGSTLFFSQRVAELVTTEHDAQWLAETAARMQPAGALRWRAHLLPPAPRAKARQIDPADPQSYASTDERYEGMSFEAYATAIERYADDTFDVVLIDGRARPSCFRHAWAKTRFGGLIVLDNAEREAYAWVAAAAQALGCELTWCWGPGPYYRYFWCTLVMRKVRERFALDDLDRKLERHLDFDGGTFIEAGANNGVAFSNTLYFEARRGWRGLLVEPIFARAQECRRLRPHAQVEHAALVAAGNPQRIATLRYADMMTVVKGGMHSAEEEDAHIRAGCEVQRVETYEFAAPTATLSGLLDKHGIDRVDLLSLDVEGYESTVLRGLDMTRHRPRFILVEARYRDDIDALLAADYAPVDTLSHHDVLYRLKQDPGAAPNRLATRAGTAAACIACATPMVEHFNGMFDERYGFPGHFALLRCPACRQLQTAPLFEDVDLPVVHANYGPPRGDSDEPRRAVQHGETDAVHAQRPATGVEPAAAPVLEETASTPAAESPAAELLPPAQLDAEPLPTAQPDVEQLPPPQPDAEPTPVAQPEAEQLPPPPDEDTVIRAAWKNALRPGLKALYYGRGIEAALREAQAAGADAAGIEADLRAAVDTAADGSPPIHVGALDESAFGDATFDLIALDRVLEFAPRPDALLATLAQRLRPGGRVLLSLPNADSVYAERFGRRWIQWCLPYRQHHFNRGSLQRFVARQGWEIVSLRTITPDAWKLVQMRAARETARMGLAHPLWTGKPAPDFDPAVTPSPALPPMHAPTPPHDTRGALAQKLRALVERGRDALGRGDFMLVELKRRTP